jgi:hypothetical protein
MPPLQHSPQTVSNPKVFPTETMSTPKVFTTQIVSTQKVGIVHCIRF